MASRREAVGFLLLGLGAMMLCLSPAGLARTGHTKGTVDATPTERREALDAEPRSDVVVSACGGLAAKTRPERTHRPYLLVKHRKVVVFRNGGADQPDLVVEQIAWLAGETVCVHRPRAVAL